MTEAATTGGHSPGPGGASAAAIQHHYDLSTDFFRLWLDDSITYSCARWDSAQTLEEAQQRKIALLADWANAHGSSRVLDIGCGWGSMLHHLVEQCDVTEAVGLTLSREQYSYVAATSDPRVIVRAESWENHRPAVPYDAIVCVGALEHFVRFGRPRSEKVVAYRRFFERCGELLCPGGALALQTIAKGNVPLDSQAAVDLMFIAGKIFPESDVPRLAELCHAVEKRFEVISVINDRMDYARTCREWLARLTANRSAAASLVGEDAVHLYERYLACSARQFERGQTTLLRIGLRRI